MELREVKSQSPLGDIYNPETTHPTATSTETQQVGSCCKIPHHGGLLNTFLECGVIETER